MVKQIPFTKYEAALLLDAYLKVLSGDLSRMDSVKNCSQLLRAMAVNSGIEIDDIYRNVNGISFQMASMESAYQGKTIMKPATQLFTEIVQLLRENNKEYHDLLNKAKDMARVKHDNEAVFIAWLSKNVSATQLSELHLALSEIEQQAKKLKLIKGMLYDNLDFPTVKKVELSIEQSEIFKFMHKRQWSHILSALAYLLQYVRQKSKDGDKEAVIAQPAHPAENVVVGQVGFYVADQAATEDEPIISMEEISTFNENIETVENATFQEEIISVPENAQLQVDFGQDGTYRRSEDRGGEISEKTSNEEWIITQLKAQRLTYQDKRSLGGCLWIAGDHGLDAFVQECRAKGYTLSYKADGCKTYPNRSVWWTKDHPKHLIKATPVIPTGKGEISLDAFKRFLIQEKGFADRTAGNYRTSIRMIEAYIQRNHLDFSLLNTDTTGAQKIFNLLMARPDFEQINIQRHHQFSAALAQFVIFLRQGGSMAPEGEHKLMGEKTIMETVFDVLRQAGKPMTVSEIYQAIIRDNLYPFGAQNPQSVVYSKVSLACRQTNARIKEGRDVLIRAEKDGRKVFRVMSAKEAAVFLENQQRKSELETASPWAEYEAVLKQAFPKGFQKESGLDMKKLRKRWVEIHGEELKDSDATVRLQLTAHCVDTGKRWYLAELLLSDEDRWTVLQYIERVLNSGKPVLYYSSIYAALEHQLESAVLTEDLLVSYLLATCQDRYILREHYLTNDRHAQVNLPEEITDVMLAYGRPIHTDELKQALHHFPPNQVERELHIHSEFIMDAFHTYFHESMADLTAQELDQIAAFIQEELDNQGYMIGDWIQRKLVQLYPETAERLSFLTPLGVRGAVAYKLRNRFTFSGPVITLKGNTMSMTDIFAMFCQRHAPFTLDELTAFAKECDSTIYMDTVHRNCARVSETEFVETGAVRWDIPRVDAAIALHCPGKYVSLKNIQYFDAFPYVGYSWNSYLLEQYVATVSKNFTLMHSSYAKNNVSGAIVRRDAGLDFFDDVLADILANAPVDLEKDPCLEHLANAGYITRKKLSSINEIITRAKMLRSQKG